MKKIKHLILPVLIITLFLGFSLRSNAEDTTNNNDIKKEYEENFKTDILYTKLFIFYKKHHFEGKAYDALFKAKEAEYNAQKIEEQMIKEELLNDSELVKLKNDINDSITDTDIDNIEPSYIETLRKEKIKRIFSRPIKIGIISLIVIIFVYIRLLSLLKKQESNEKKAKNRSVDDN